MASGSVRGMGLTRHQKNEIFGKPGVVAPVVVQDRLPWMPRTKDGRVQTVVVHPLIADVFVEACWAASKVSTWIPHRMDSVNIRAIRGKEKGWYPGGPNTSNHSWATAVDFFSTFADIPPPGGVWTPNNGMPVAFAAAFEDLGFTWGGRWRRTDTPHIEWSASAPATRLAGQELLDWLDGMVKLGETSDQVALVQTTVSMIGLHVPTTGVFDHLTKARVVEAQRLAGVKDDGLVGPQTEAALVALLAAEIARAPHLVVERAFRSVFGRPASATDLAAWGGWMADRGGLRMAETFWASDEAVKLRSAPAIDLEPLPNGSADTPAVVPEQSDRQRLRVIAVELDEIASRV